MNDLTQRRHYISLPVGRLKEWPTFVAIVYTSRSSFAVVS
jgi:hypothetical protein